jgi:hypothetical protein
MKFHQKVLCPCGETFSFDASGTGDWSTSVCPKCRTASWMMDALSVSVPSERLLYRAKHELQQGDFSLCIIIGAIAAEGFMSALFFKMKNLDSGIFGKATEEQEEIWEEEYRGLGKFKNKANAVAMAATGQSVNDFVKADFEMKRIALPADLGPLDHFQTALMNRRNRVLHQGDLNYSEADAIEAEAAARAIAAICRRMDRVRFQHL